VRYRRGLKDTGEHRIGVLVVNLGTPEAPVPSAVRRYLAQFLHDQRVVELTRLFWWPILHGLILRTRPRRRVAAYRRIWQEQGAPLLCITAKQANGITAALLSRYGGKFQVEFAMRYGKPSIDAVLEHLANASTDRIVVLPLYPQYSCSTTGSVYDAVGQTLKHWRNLPSLRLVRDYHLDDGYLDALAASVREHWVSHGQADKLLLSFHGTPERYRQQGDPYQGQCLATAGALAIRLGLTADNWQVTFQSRFGKAPWLTPYTEQTLIALARAGSTSVDVICPGFSADCLETLEEINQENRAAFLAAGGQTFHYIPCLNDRADHVTALADVIARQTSDWLSAS
jgi:ferrochelatase|tara:strand:- start:4668 stop:5693 length:1026 start_codon:yes stop_codon:yes gene_type:complete